MIYFLRHIETGLIRIGTTNSIDTRLLNHKANYGDVSLMGLMVGYEEFENELHHKFHHLNETKVLKGREWFRPEKELLDYISKYTSSDIPLPMGERKRHRPLPSSKAKKSTGVRVSSETQKLVRMLAGEIQLETGKLCSDDMAVRYLLAKAYPEIAKG